MSFQGKKILFLCKETYSYPLYFLAKKCRTNNTIGAYFFMSPECMYNKCNLNETTYYKYLELDDVQVYDVKSISTEFTQNLKNPSIDAEYLKFIEENFTNFKSINLQLMSSQFTSKYYHNRFYFKNFTSSQQIYWIQLQYKNAISVIDDFKPDMILDLDDAELPRTIINEIAYKRGIPYITLEHPRYEFYKYPTYSMGIGIDKYILDLYNQIMKLADSELTDERLYIQNYQQQMAIMPLEYKNTITAQYTKTPIIPMLKNLLGKVIYFLNQDITAKNYGLKRKNKLIYPDAIKYIKFYFQVEFRKRHLLSKNSYFSDPVEGEQYIYMPLHLIPESTTFVKAPFYVNELFVIEEISKSLPIGMMLYVKEHQAMLGERDLKFYKRVNELPNVKLVTVNYYKDPKPWIVNAKGVITITGTSAYEAALLGKKAIVFGDVPFSIIDGITRVKSFEQLPTLIKDFSSIDNMHSCAAYIATVKKAGVELKLKYLMSEGEDILYNRTKQSSEYDKQIESLEKFYEEAYERYLKDK